MISSILNYQPGSRGDLLTGCLLESPVKYNDMGLCETIKDIQQLKGFEQKHGWHSNNAIHDEQSFVDEILEKYDYFSYYKLYNCHCLCSLTDLNSLKRLQEIFNLYQLAIEDHNFHIPGRLLFIKVKVNSSNYKNIEDISMHFNQAGKFQLYLHRLKLTQETSMQKVWFDRLFKPPYQDYEWLYEKINGKQLTLKKYEYWDKMVKATELPKTYKFFDTECSIDIDKGTITPV